MYLPQQLVKPLSADVTNFDLAGSPTIERFMNSRAQVQGLMGPFGSGKSAACVAKMIELAHEMPPSSDGLRHVRFVVVRNTYPELRDTTMRTVYEWLPPLRWGRVNNETHTYTIDAFEKLELEIMFRALDRPDHIAKLLSMEASHAWINEARELPKEILGPLRGRLGRYPRRGDVGDFAAQLIMDTNPPDASEDSWWYQLFEVQRPNGVEIFKQPGGRAENAENLRNLPRDYYTNMLSSMDESEIRVYVDGEYGFLRKGKEVYPDYKDNWHCKEFDVQPYTILRCWDFGLTPACVFLQIYPNGQVRAIDEIVSDRAGIRAFAPIVTAHTTQQYPWTKRQGALNDIGDPSGEYGSTGNGTAQEDELSCFQMLSAAGVECMPGVQEPTVRYEAVRQLLRNAIGGEPGFLVHPRCTRLRKGFQGEYHYRRLAIGGGVARFSEKPEKNKYSHPHDALQYGAVELIGDRVLGLSTPLDIARQQTHAVSDFDPLEIGYKKHNALDEFFRVGR